MKTLKKTQTLITHWAINNTVTAQLYDYQNIYSSKL